MPTTILTGASRGIGKAIAEIFLETSPSNNLVAVARDKGALEALQKQYGDRVAVVAGDVTEKATVDSAISAALAFGQLDSIIANAGVLSPVDEQVEKIDLDEWRKLFEINYFSVVALVQAAVPHLRKTHGKVIVVSSGASTKAYRGWYAYGSSKAAINSFVQHLGEAEKDIQAISVAPGVVDTAMQKDIREVFGSTMGEGVARFHEMHEKKQLLAPEVPARVYVNLVMREWKEGFDGAYLRYNDERLGEYQRT